MAIRTVYPRGRHQRCWVHKMRNTLEKARKRDYASTYVYKQLDVTVRNSRIDLYQNAA